MSGASMTLPNGAPAQRPDHDLPVSFRNIWIRPLTKAAIAQDLGEDVK